MVVGNVDLTRTRMFKNGALRDSDLLSGYDISPENTVTPVRIGTRDLASGHLVGRMRRVGFFDRTLSESELTALWQARTLDEE